MTKSGTYTPTGAQALQPMNPMPASVANNINLGWNSATGQVIQPLSQQMQSGAYTAPIGNLGIKIPTQTVYPVAPGARPGAPTGLFNTTATSKTQANYNMGRR